MLENHTHIIRQRATDNSGREVPLKNIRTWAELPDEIRIDNVDRLLFAHLKSPVDNRKDKGLYGVPLTYGSERLVAEIQEHLKIIAREYKLTRPMLGLDSRLWSSPLGFGGAASPNGSPTSIGDVRKSVQDGDDPFIPVDNYYDEGKTPWLVYSPPIRDSAMYKRLDELFALLEKSVGTSRGILTARETANATATEIRSANHDTYTIITAIRKAWESALDDLAYAYDVYAEYFGLTPMGARDDYAIKLDWDMSLFESSSETFQQYIELLSQGVVSKPEVRQWMRGESLEDAERAIAAISEREGNGIIDRLLSAGEE